MTDTKDFLQPDGHYVVVGLGASGLSAAQYLHKHAYQTTVNDAHPAPPLAKHLPDGVATVFGGLDSSLLAQATGIVLSPGIDPAQGAIKEAIDLGVPVVNDIDLFAKECQKRGIDIVAITGSNAKSTVTTLVGEMAKQAGRRCAIGGNIGTPALSLLDEPIDLAVLELSSFQLEWVNHLNAKVATLLNFSEDHLDRHGTMQTYLAAKLRVFDGCAAAVLPCDDPHLLTQCQNATAHAKTVKVGAGGDYWIDKGFLKKNNQTLTHANTLYIKGQHNLTNALFALAIGDTIGLPMDAMLQSLQSFKGLPHRCQYVAIHGVSAYFNDSKGTNVGATLAAITGLGQSYGQGSLVVILGGQGKGQSFLPLAPALQTYAQLVLTIGEDAALIARDLGDCVPVLHCHTLDQAVKKAASQTAPCVLLSPACASFDQFLGYADRGEHFCKLVQGLVNDHDDSNIKHLI